MIVDIRIEGNGWKAVSGLKTLVKRVVNASLDEDRNASVSFLFTDDAEAQILNRDWRGKDYPTNVLSFPVAQSAPVPRGEVQSLGDIVMAFGVIAGEALEQKKTLAQHVSHLTVHGLLHLLGYDHETDEDARNMEAREAMILERLGVENPYILS